MIDRLARFISGVSFHRGLALGALVGAAIAGSTLWTRLRDAQQAARDRDARAEPPGQESPTRDLEV
jgi:cytochrome c-type biogenesis protein CcmH/NrfG